MADTTAQQLTERRKDLAQQALVGLQEALNNGDLENAIKTAIYLLRAADQQSKALRQW